MQVRAHEESFRGRRGSVLPHDVTPRIALTSGEPAGIGPELCLALAREELPCELVCLADRTLLSERATQLNLAVTLHSYAYRAGAAGAAHRGGSLGVDPPPL